MITHARQSTLSLGTRIFIAPRHVSLMSRVWSFVVSGIVAILFLSAPYRIVEAAPASADLIIHNGKILTVDDNFSIAQAAAIKDGKFIAVGSSSRVFRFEGPNTRSI